MLGLGPLREPLLGNIIWAAQLQGAFFNGWWWWPIVPSVAMILILGSLALINMGLDELANPRVRRTGDAKRHQAEQRALIKGLYEQ